MPLTENRIRIPDCPKIKRSISFRKLYKLSDIKKNLLNSFNGKN